MDNIVSVLYSGLCILIIIFLVRGDLKKINNSKKNYKNKKILKENKGSDNNE